ncbi:response regulator [Spirosoma linguale]|uniref:Response regulator receiver protein n=1 Tax=Spirosoma linguale (strain ATCC 33905 / DSM 74 / LMG 10896 / Claus 1) TaxID=504472 RepID=D2QDR6_SPILD|nr:response regulator receiver protein [Spirosoma linguale DSM 74]
MPLRSNQHCEIILFDEDDDDYFFLKKAFQAHSDQITLHHLTDPATLLASLQSATTLPSLILLDLQMRGNDGFDILNSLKQDVHLRDVPVVVWSAAMTDQQVNHCYQAGASSVVIKSDNQLDLERVIRHLCDYWFSAVQLPFYAKQSDC